MPSRKLRLRKKIKNPITPQIQCNIVFAAGSVRKTWAGRPMWPHRWVAWLAREHTVNSLFAVSSPWKVIMAHLHLSVTWINAKTPDTFFVAFSLCCTFSSLQNTRHGALLTRGAKHLLSILFLPLSFHYPQHRCRPSSISPICSSFKRTFISLV